MSASPPGGPDLSRLRLAPGDREAPTAMTPTWVAALAGVALALLGAGVAWFARGAVAPAPTAPSGPAAVTETRALPAAPPSSVMAGGRVEASGRRELSVSGPGVVAVVHVSRGSLVHAGDVLLELEAQPERADVAQAQAAVEAARARLDEAREGARPEELEVARRDAEAAQARAADAAEKLAQARGLLATGATTRAQALEAQRTAEAEVSTARAASARAALLEKGTRRTGLATAAAELTRARAGLAQAEARLALRRLVAPIDGTVLEVRVRTGEGVGGQNLPPVVLADLGHLEVRVDVPEGKAGLVRVGDPAVITVEALADTTFAGRVTEVGLEADRQKGTLEVAVAFAPGADLTPVRPRMAARVAIDVKQRPNPP